MWFSQRTEYALRAVLELSQRSHQPGWIRAADIAESQSIPPKFLELILVELRNAGIVISQRGAIGGHRLARQPGKIAVGDVLRAVDNPFDDNIRSEKKEPANNPFGFVWREIDERVCEIVDHVTVEEIQNRCAASQAMADFTI